MASGDPSLNWRCSLCDPEHQPAPEDPPEDEIWAARNCQGSDEDGSHLAFAFDSSLRRCPKAAIDPLAMAWLDLFSRWKAVGQLPEPGDWNDQSAIIGEAFLVLEIATLEQQQSNQQAATSKAAYTPEEV